VLGPGLNDHECRLARIDASENSGALGARQVHEREPQNKRVVGAQHVNRQDVARSGHLEPLDRPQITVGGLSTVLKPNDQGAPAAKGASGEEEGDSGVGGHQDGSGHS
jgi:hypothetical protein